MKKILLLAGVAFAMWGIFRRATKFDSPGPHARPAPNSGSEDHPDITELADRLQHGWADLHHTQA